MKRNSITLLFLIIFIGSYAQDTSKIQNKFQYDPIILNRNIEYKSIFFEKDLPDFKNYLNVNLFQYSSLILKKEINYSLSLALDKIVFPSLDYPKNYPDKYYLNSYAYSIDYKIRHNMHNAMYTNQPFRPHN